MKITVLGCSGGIGRGYRTSCYQVDDDLLIDCGSGAGDLPLEALRRIRHVFLTHSHLDHVAFLPFLVDTVFAELTRHPLTVYLLRETLDTLREHVFNWAIWPDFSRLPNAENPVLRFRVIERREVVEVGNRRIEAIPVSHTVAALGYRVESPSGGSFAYTGDSTENDLFWEALNAHGRLDHLFAECSFPDREREIARQAGHYHSSLLAADLGKLTISPRVAITHMTPPMENDIMAELRALTPDTPLTALTRGDVFTL